MRDANIKAYIKAAHGIISAKFSKLQRPELGLTIPE